MATTDPDHLASTETRGERDLALAARARRGNLEAFAELVERHRQVVVRVASRIVGTDDAEDVAQDAFLRAFHRLDRFRAEGSFRAWLLTITNRAALDHLARRRTDRHAPAPVETGPASELPSPARLPADALESRERIERLEGKLSLLGDERRLVLILRDIEGLTYEEIAEVADVPLGTVKTRLHRARNHLIELLRANTYDWELPHD
jgi:RNA polymerase sigma-70 factor (ECF subfamily)